MHQRLLFVAALTATAVPAQSFFIPDNVANSGSCNVFPFGSTGGANLKYQQLVTAADLGNLPNLITGLGFAQCGAGVHHFDSIEIVLDHRAAATLTSTFANNLTANAVTVLSATDYDWNMPADSWSEVGLQNFFAYNGSDNLVVQITVTGSQWTSTSGVGSPGLRAGSHQRVFANNWTTAPPAIGTLSAQFALKIEVDMGTAKLSSHGRGCPGSNGLAPISGGSGLPTLGGSIALTLADGVFANVAFWALGFDIGAPFPIDGAVLGMPSCMLYFAPASLSLQLTDITGAASVAVTVPNDPALLGARAFSQWACYEPTVNAFGFTTSNYVRIQVGT